MNLFIRQETLWLQIIPASAFLIAFLLPCPFSPESPKISPRWIPTQFALFSILAFVVLVAVNRFVLTGFMNSADEHSCFFFAKCLLQLKLWAPAPTMPEFFNTPHLGVMEGKWFSVFPPGWPMLWAAAMKIGMGSWFSQLLTALGFFFILLTGNKIYGYIPTLIAATLMIVSPFFLFTGAAYFSHNACLFLLGIFFFSTFKWTQSPKMVWPVLAGLSLGFALATRYLTVGAMSFPVLCYLGYLWVWKRQLNGRGVAGFCLAAGVITLVHMYYNFLVTGSFLEAPNHYLHSHEKLGFIAGYTPQLALESLYARIVYLIDWTPPLFVMALIISLFLRPKSTWDLILRLSVILLPVAYLFYYSWGGNQYGPRYYFEAYPLACLLLSSKLYEFSKGSVKKLVALRVGVIASLLASIPILGFHSAYFRQVSLERRAAYDLVDSETNKPALIFISGFLGDKLVLSPEDSVRNSPFLDGPVVYAHDLGEKNKQVAAIFPGRHLYKVHYDRSLNRPELEQINL